MSRLSATRFPFKNFDSTAVDNKLKKLKKILNSTLHPLPPYKDEGDLQEIIASFKSAGSSKTTRIGEEASADGTTDPSAATTITPHFPSFTQLVTPPCARPPPARSTSLPATAMKFAAASFSEPTLAAPSTTW